MTHSNKTLSSIIIICTFAMISASCATGKNHDPGQSDIKKVDKKMTEFIGEVQSYSAKQKDKAVKEIKVTLDEFDAKIDKLEEKMAENWDDMDQKSRKQTNQYMSELRKKRRDLAEWYGSMKHSSADAWDDIKDGFSDSYRELEDAFEDAKSNF